MDDERPKERETERCRTKGTRKQRDMDNERPNRRKRAIGAKERDEERQT